MVLRFCSGRYWEYGFIASMVSESEGGTIEIRLGSPDGKLVGRCIAGRTAAWQDVYLIFKGESEEEMLFNFDWWAF